MALAPAFTLPTLAEAGGFLQGLGSLSGLFGGKGKKGPDLDDQEAAQLRYERRSFRQKLDLADEGEKRGIHRLISLGVPPAGSFNFSIPGSGGGSSFGERLENAGAGISRAAGAMTTTMDRLQERFLLSQIEGQELENSMKASQLRMTTGPMMPPPFPASAFDLKKVPSAPRIMKVYDPDGRTVRIFNSNDGGDNEAMQIHDYFLRTLPDELRNAVGRTVDHIRQKSSRSGYKKYLRR